MSKSGGCDILDTIAQLQHSFKSMGLEPPAALLMASHEDGTHVAMEIAQMNRFISTIDDGRLGRPIEMANGSTYMEVEVMGLKIRWPANRLAVPDGSWRFV